jgi:hypothetical protein
LWAAVAAANWNMASKRRSMATGALTIEKARILKKARE